MTSKYQDFSESLVVLGEPKCTSIFPTKGPHAGKETKVLEVLTYHPNFEKKADGSFERKEPDFYSISVQQQKIWQNCFKNQCAWMFEVP